MKPEIHPEMVECVITCVCGATHKTLAIQSTMRVDICGKCHPSTLGSKRVLLTLLGALKVSVGVTG